MRTSARPRCADLKWVLSGCGWKLGVQSRAVMRSAKSRSSSGRGHEVPPGSADGAEPGWNRGEQLLQRRSSGEPELVGIGVQDPVGPEVRRGEPRHARDPLALTQVVAGLADQVEHAVARVALEDLRRLVLGAVVRRDDEIHACAEVVRDLRVDDVGLVADEEGHHELHAGGEVSSALQATHSGATA